MKDGFQIRWEAEDGYVGGDRPHHVTVRRGDLDEDMNEEELKSLFWDTIQNDFEESVRPFSDMESRFVEWAKAEIEKMKTED